MSLIYSERFMNSNFRAAFADYLGEMRHFCRKIDRWHLLLPLLLMKTTEWSIYRWYKTPVRRYYGVKGNELIYMITRRCNEQCAKCGIWENPEKEEERIDVNVFLDSLRALHRNLYQVTITGGEPLLFMDDVLAIAEEASRLGVPLFVVTNGTLINERFLDAYQRLGHTLVISLDTLDAEKWPSFRGRDSYRTVMDNIALAGKKLGSRLKIQSVDADESRAGLSEIRKFCDHMGIGHVIQPYMDFGGTWHDSRVFKENGKDEPCAARKNICVFFSGHVVKCFDHHRIPIAKEPLGNIAEEDIVTILCKTRSTQVTRQMKSCNLPCKRLSCNLPPVLCK
ncbi:MAG: radical SAM protein [Kiritimatiellales bacterium]|jgi:pyruvate-formate lyase-activating enzyme